MKKLFIAHLLLLVSMGAFSAKRADWDNVKVLQINREKPHANMMVFGSLQWTLDKPWVDYSSPQENGYRSNTRWLSLTNDIRLRITGDPLIGFGASHYPKDEMHRAEYFFELNKHSEVFLNIDHKQMGIDGTTSWMNQAFPHQYYRLKNEDYQFTYRLSPIN